MRVLSLFLKVAVGASLIAGLVVFGLPDVPSVPLGNLDPANVDDGGPSEGVVEKRVAALSNDERRADGLGTLEQSSDLAEVAVGHSRDMGAKDYFSHEAPDGETMEDRYAADDLNCRSSGENIFHMSYEGQSYTNDELAQMTVEHWMDSPGHRDNLLSPNFDEQGIGVEIVHTGEETEVYVTQNFCG